MDNKHHRLVMLVQLLIVIAVVTFWEAMVWFGLADSFYISSPSLIAKHVAQWASDGVLWGNIIITLSEAVVGLIFGIMLGLLFAIFLFFSPFYNEVLKPFISVLNSLPRIAFAPLIVLWFGFGFLSKVIIVISLVFFVVFFSVYNGLNNIDRTIIKNAEVIGASKLQIAQHIYLPCAYYWTLATLRLSIGYAVIAAIIGEYVGASGGIGYLIDNAQSMFDATGVMAGLFVLTACVYLIDILIEKMEPLIIPWRSDQ